ncbi:MAG: hypothetical protein CL608_21960 [Anaerolineaceae bacterium]|nr:hypothetical protein [Anaerolineaceae bacterium]
MTFGLNQKHQTPPFDAFSLDSVIVLGEGVQQDAVKKVEANVAYLSVEASVFRRLDQFSPQLTTHADKKLVQSWRK